VKVGVVTFPGSLDDRDAMHAVEAGGAQAVPLWHADTTVGDVDAIILPGGFSYGDYLRCGAVAHRAPVMEAVAAFAK
jgi:phosphoribosylformylglycinamidine synthase subunit PurQ / glutaminase